MSTSKTPNDFITILSLLDDGNVHANLTEQLRRTVGAVLDTGKNGRVTLTLSIEKEGKVLLLSGKVSVKTPQAATEPSMFYADKHGYLQREDPQQVPLRGVAMPTAAPLRQVGEKLPSHTGGEV